MANPQPPRETVDASSDLPVQLTSFVGREREVAEVRELLAETRLLTLTGAGGVGKTRLALQVANDLVTAFRDGVWCVELAPLSDSKLVAGAVTSSIGVKEQPGRSARETLVAFLHGRSVLLVFDNCEHLVTTCAELVDHLLRSCPDLHVLATSRQRLGVPGERAWRVPSLSLPNPASLTGTDEIAACEAVRLFVERARSADRAFVLGDRNAGAIAQLCQRLDGIPLAIELAAARIAVLTPEQIVARLDDRFRLLVGGSRTAPSRQQTLHATLAWSYELLDDAERALFLRLSVFAGGFTLDAAEAVCSSDAVPSGDTLDVLTRLVDKSLIVVDVTDSAAARYGMLETLRQYGWERLTEGDEREKLQQRHADYLLLLTEQAELPLMGLAQQGVWLDRLEREHGNVRAALRWAIERRRAETGVRLVAGVYRFWYLRGYLGEGRRWFDQVLAEAGGAPLGEQARAFRGAGLLAYAASDLVAAVALTERSLRLARELNDGRLIAAALINLGIILIDQGEYTDARVRSEEALALARETGYEVAIPMPLNNLGLIAVYEAEYDTAVAYLEESLAVATANRQPGSVAWSTGNLGHCAFRRGDFAEARSRYRQSLALGLEVGDKRVIVERLEELAWVAANQDQAERAARLFGAAQCLRETIGAAMPPANRADNDRSLGLVRARLGEASVAELLQQGKGLSLEQAIDEAMQVEAREVMPRGSGSLGPLTQREQEVALLVGRGLSNREIADTLVVSLRTAEAHVTHVLNKLGMRSRSQIAIWALEHGLHR